MLIRTEIRIGKLTDKRHPFPTKEAGHPVSTILPDNYMDLWPLLPEESTGLGGLPRNRLSSPPEFGVARKGTNVLVQMAMVNGRDAAVRTGLLER